MKTYLVGSEAARAAALKCGIEAEVWDWIPELNRHGDYTLMVVDHAKFHAILQEGPGIFRSPGPSWYEATDQ